MAARLQWFQWETYGSRVSAFICNQLQIRVLNGIPPESQSRGLTSDTKASTFVEVFVMKE